MALGDEQALPSLDVWTSALLSKSTAGRGSNGKLEAYGIKKLRELILELAVRGKLVAQDANDEPSAELLKRVATDKAQLVKAGIVRKEKDFPPIEEDEFPFSLPEGWEWARINDVGHDWGQKTPDATFTYIDVSAIDNSSGIISLPTILSASDAPSRARKIVQRGTVIYSTVRPYLKNICVIEEHYEPEPIASTAFAILHPLQGMPGKFFAFYFRSPEFVKYVESVQTGIAYPAINDKQFYGGLVPVPPLSEQHRIVAKVDELMALCDQLEQQQTDSLAAHQTLVETLLGTLTQPTVRAVAARPSTGSGRTDFEEAWACIASHFDTLLTTEASIDQFKQTVRQLAVMGKLVPQDPNDEPASELLKKIAAEKAKLVKEGKVKKEKPLPPIAEEDRPLDLPTGWEWAQLGDCCTKITDGEHATPLRSPSGNYLLSARNVTNEGILLHDVDYVPDEEFARIRKRCDPNIGDVLISCSGSVGRVALVDRNNAYAMVRSAAMVRPAFIRPGYLALCLRSPVLQEQMVAKSRQSAQANLFLGAISSLLVALPPVQEQELIVAKVDELMALCDTLKARIKDAQAIQVHLADAVVERAVC